ncbi:ABC transporter ATP-binding protein [Tepidiforma sp.]|uniref:ABC transporter ATP-binding protein n=1 Tax=Tepidiforma sp. TaxID=2682230 RepID=UPI002633B2C9|nr:ABC transporter ATP-binding protein [Tepidiforma sp.]MCX7618456.1 ABC transporter ATP-binding protein [Tepidiforma sp.]
MQRCPRSSSSGSRSSPSWCWPGEATLRPSNPDPSPRPAAEALRIDAVDVHYGRFRAVHGATLVLAPGELVALLGRSGSGKTTLLRAVAGFERVTAGEIRLAGELIESPQHHVPAHRRSVGLVFQEYALFPNQTVAGNIGYGLPRGERGRVEALLRLAHLEGLEGRYPHQLSGGQQQRVALLRSLAPRPRVLLLDEPFSNLDAGLRVQMRDEVAAILRAEGMTALLVTHDRADAMAIADRVAVMDAGEIVEVATPRALYFEPATRTAASYGGDVQFVPGEAFGAAAECPLGQLPLARPFRGPCDLLIRPEWLRLRHGGTPARVCARRFEGAVTRLDLEVGGHLLRMTAPSSDLADPGEAVAVTVAVPAVPFPRAG